MILSMVLIIEIAILATLCFVFLYQAVFVFASLFSSQNRRTGSSIPTHRIAVLIPAHNEELLIARCLHVILSADYPEHLRNIYVVADNCSDGTKEKVESFPVVCFQREDAVKTGKGYAIQWGLEQINLREYDAVLFIDADAVVSSNIFLEMDRLLGRGERAIQVYNGTLNPEDSWLTRCGHLSDVLQFELYFKGREVLGLTSRLLGNGMCLHREVLERVPWRAYSITENWEYYCNVLLSGYRVAFTPHVCANSDQVGSLKQARSQKTRWQTGWAEVARRYVPHLLALGLKRRDLRLLDAAIDFLLPSAAMQTGIMTGAMVGVLVLNRGFLLWWTGIVGLMGCSIVVVSLLIARAGLMDYIAICYAPVYVAWKMLLRVRLIGRIGAKDWVRTVRRAKRLPE